MGKTLVFWCLVALKMSRIFKGLEWELRRTGFEAALLLRPNILADMGRKARKALPTKG